MSKSNNPVHFAFDFDTRTIESKSTDGNTIAKYIVDNGLELAIALISSEEDLCLELSFNEIVDLYNNLGGIKRHFDDEEHASEIVWGMLNQREDEFPEFTNKLGKKLLKENKVEEPSREKSLTKIKPKKNKKQISRPRSGNKPWEGKSFRTGTEKPRAGTVHAIFIEIIEDNLGECDFETLAGEFRKQYLKDNMTDSFIWSYLKGAIKMGRVESTL